MKKLTMGISLLFAVLSLSMFAAFPNTCSVPAARAHETSVASLDVDVAVTYFSGTTKLEVNFPVPDNPPIEPYPSPVSVTAVRLDTNIELPNLMVVIAVSLNDSSGTEVVLGEDLVILVLEGSYTANFESFTQNVSAPIYPGNYTIIAKALVVGPANDIDLTNNIIVQETLVTAILLLGDINCDGSIDMADVSTVIDAFMSSPGGPGWDIRCDLNSDNSIDMADISILIDAFMTSFDP